MVSSFKMAELWQRLGYRVVVACMGSGTRTEKVSDTLTVYFRKDIFLPDPWNYGIAFGFSGFVRRLIKQEKPDQIIVNKLLFWTSLATIPLTLSGKKVLVITDALVGMTWWPRGKIPQIAAAIYAWTAGWLILCMAHKVVFFHPQPEKLLKRLGILKKARVIPTGIDPTGYQTSDLRPQTSAKTTITYIGRLESVKGVDDYVEAAVPLTKEFPEIDIQVVGWYPSTSSGQATHPLVLKHDRIVRFTGLRDDIPEILARTDIFVLPSYSEGLSNALMEAMSSGCACIASDVGGNAFLLQNGVSGFLFPAGDREALQSHIRRLLKDPAKAKAMGEAARKRIDEMFSWEVVGKKYAELFNELKILHS
jgi:glycosyltransferase involved in cell wall biosynthesis